MTDLNISRLVVIAAAVATISAPSNVAAHDSARTKIGRALVTYYWIADESESRYPRTDEVAIRDIKGKVIARTSRKFKRDLAMEGTGLLRPPDGRTVTYMRQVNGESRFRVTSSRFGNGIGKCRLVPYRTIAVNPRFVRLGSKIFIPAFKGARLPDGTIHDGIFTANDRAPFSGAHIDFFTGVGSRAVRPFTRHGVKSLSRVSIYLDAPPDPRGCHAR